MKDSVGIQKFETVNIVRLMKMTASFATEYLQKLLKIIFEDVKYHGFFFNTALEHLLQV